MKGQCDCGQRFAVQQNGMTRMFCDDCRRKRSRAASSKWNAANREKRHKNNHNWYVANRASDEGWRKENKKRAKAWRKKKAGWVKIYDEQFRQELASQ